MMMNGIEGARRVSPLHEDSYQTPSSFTKVGEGAKNEGPNDAAPSDADADPPPIGSRVVGASSSQHPLLPPGSKPTVIDREERKVSWGDIEPDPLQLHDPFEEGDSHLSAPDHPSVPSKISLTCLIEQTPFESEAETYIQRSLDEVDATKPGSSWAQQSILSGIPEDAKIAAFASKSMSRKTGEKDLPRGHKKTKSTAEDLCNLTASLAKMDIDPNASFISSTGEDDKPSSSGDKLAKNATKLVERHKSFRKTVVAPVAHQQNHEDRKASFRTSAAGDRWKKSNQTEDVDTAKKTHMLSVAEEASDIDPGDESLDEEKGTCKSQDHQTRSHIVENTTKTVKLGFWEFEDWLIFQRSSAWSFVKMMLFLIIPCAGVAAILFYLGGNPPCGTTEECLQEQIRIPVNATNAASYFDGKSAASASVSWWLLFLGVRQVVTLALSKMTVAFLIDFFCLRTHSSVRLFGPFITLFIVQSKGWPITLFFWGIYDFALLFGDGQFAKHWLFWQDAIELFNANNPAGTVLSSPTYKSILIVAVVVSFVVALKRFWVGFHLGRRTFERFGEELAKVMKKALLIGQVAALARDIEQFEVRLADFGIDAETYHLSEEGSTCDNTTCSAGILNDLDLTTSQNWKINELLGEWEEPEIANEKDENAPVSAIVQFRQSLTYLNTPFPFTASFGPARNRQECIESTGNVYARLLLSTPGRSCLKFDTLALVAMDRDGTVDEEKVKDLIRLFRPDRDGDLALLDFAKSVDGCYKELRLLRASVSSSSKIDRAFETIINALFYFIVGCIVLAVLGLDPLVILTTISCIVVGFAFAIGPACSKYVEGVLLILVRRPYSIGDRIHVSAVEDEASTTGSPGWIVKDVNLYSTTVIYGVTNEVATYSNGSLASTRIINAARSPKAVLNVMLKFPIDTPYKKIQVFRNALEEFVKDRPRQWARFMAFRATMVCADLGYVEYTVLAQHRESWQQIGSLLTSKAELSSFALELTKKMNVRYVLPPMPVDLTVKQDTEYVISSTRASVSNSPKSGLRRRKDAMSDDGSLDISSVAAMFGPNKK